MGTDLGYLVIPANFSVSGAHKYSGWSYFLEVKHGVQLPRQFANLILGPYLVGNMPLACALPPAELQQKWHYSAWLYPGVWRDRM